MYKVLYADSLLELEHKVTTAFADGYVPVGGMVIYKNIYHQPVFKFPVASQPYVKTPRK